MKQEQGLDFTSKIELCRAWVCVHANNTAHKRQRYEATSTKAESPCCGQQNQCAHLSTAPLADAWATRVCKHGATDLLKGVDEAIALDGGTDLFAAWGDREWHLALDACCQCLHTHYISLVIYVQLFHPAVAPSAPPDQPTAELQIPGEISLSAPRCKILVPTYIPTVMCATKHFCQFQSRAAFHRTE